MKKAVVPGLLILECIIAGLGLFLKPDQTGMSQLIWLAGFLLIAFAIAYRDLFLKRTYQPFPFIILAAVLLNFFIQLTGGIHSFLWPAYFVFACAVAIFLPFFQTIAATGIILAIEGSNIFFSGREEADNLPIHLSFAVALIAVPGIISHIIRRTRKEADQARDEHERLIEHADAVDPLSETGTIEALTDESRLASNVNAARSLEDSFSGLIDLIYGFVPAHAYALFLKERLGEREEFVLRASRSDADGTYLAPLGETLAPEKDNGIISGCTRYLQPQYLSNIEQAVGTLGYYTRTLPIKSILAVPIVHNDVAIGVLVVDSLEGGAFSLETQDMIGRFAPFFIQILEKIRVSQDLSVRAATFAAMHKIEFRPEQHPRVERHPGPPVS